MEGFLIVIADDFTGGMDTGACFAMSGFPTCVISDPALLNDASALLEGVRAVSVNTASRGLNPRDAYSRVSDWARRLSLLPVHRVYKKMDSTLRGQPGAELDAVMDVLGIPLAFVAPAFPQQGRCTVGGIHLMDGRPIGATEIGNDAVTPVAESRLPALLAAQSRRRTALVDLVEVAAGSDALERAIRRETDAGAQLLVFDAVRREHLRSVARAALKRGGHVCAVGSAGLAREIAEELGASRPRRRASMRKRLKNGPAMVVCGSRSPRAIRQVSRVCEVTGAALVAIRARSNGMEKPFGSESLEQAAGAVLRGLEAGITVLTLEIDAASLTQPPPPSMAGLCTEALAAVCRMVMEAGKTPPGGLVLTGGDTAFAVLQELGIGVLEVVGEIGPGLPLGFSRLPRFPGLPVITKAGAFGGPDALVRCVRYLDKDRNK